MSDIDREKAPHLPVPKNREEIDHAIRLAIDGYINLADHIDVWLLDLRAQARAAEDAGEVTLGEGVWGQIDTWPLEMRLYYHGLVDVASNRLRKFNGQRVSVVIRATGGKP